MKIEIKKLDSSYSKILDLTKYPTVKAIKIFDHFCNSNKFEVTLISKLK